MITISQDKDRFTDAHSFSVVDAHIGYEIQAHDGMVMGIYSGKESAEKVLLDIAGAIASEQKVFFVPSGKGE